MGIFVDYPSSPFANLSAFPTTILVADTNVLWVNQIMVCNTKDKDMRFNLKKIRTKISPIEIFYINQFEIKAYQTVDIVAELGLQIHLEFSTSPSISDSLVCFSNGYTQEFDCEVTYSRLNELPLTF